MFPRYIRDQSTLSNSASAAMNKWLKQNVSNEFVVHSLRHAFRDRLRNVGTPTDVIDVVGGWARAGIGETYGRGHNLRTTRNGCKRSYSYSTILGINTSPGVISK